MIIKIERTLTVILLILVVLILAEMFQDRYAAEKKSVNSVQQIGLSDTEDGKTKENDDAAKALPTRYDLREAGKMPEVRGQGENNNCWAEAAATALDSYFLPEKQIHISSGDFETSALYMKEAVEEGSGSHEMVISYLVSWKGPRIERGDLDGDGADEEEGTIAAHVQGIELLTDADTEELKRAIADYGAIGASLHMDENYTNGFSTSIYYNQLEYSYCYKDWDEPQENREGYAEDEPQNALNHDVVLLGWDDSFPASAFNVDVSCDGAFICQNSWGESFGDHGVFYVSYEDQYLGKSVIVYTDIESVHNYDHIYQTDIQGMVGSIGYGNDSCWFANVFQTEEDELLKAVGFYAVGENTEYSIYVLEGEQLSNAAVQQTLASGTFSNAGFHTVSLGEGVEMKAGNRYSVVIRIRTEGTEYPVAAEYVRDDMVGDVDITDGDGYISKNGMIWQGTETDYQCNVCMKIYTEDIKDED